MRHKSILGRLAEASSLLQAAQPCRVQGKVTGVSGLALDIAGLSAQLSVGDRVTLTARTGQDVMAEIVGFRGQVAQAMAFGTLDGIGPGSPAQAPLHVAPSALRAGATLSPCAAWLGRVIDPLGRPSDGKGALPLGPLRPRRERERVER